MFKYALMAGVMMSLAMPAYATQRGPSNNGPSNNNGPTQVTAASTNNVTNRNANVNANVNTNRNTNRNTNTNVNANRNSVNVANRGGDVNVSGVGGTGYVEQRQVPAFVAGTALPPVCGAAFNAGGANQNGTGALGFSWETESCRKDRLANRMAALGAPQGGLALLCTMEEVREAMAAAGTPCPTNVQASTVQANVSTPAPQVTPAASATPQLTAREQQIRAAMLARGMDPVNFR